MKRIVWVACLLGVAAWGDQADDRAEIGRVIAELNAVPVPAGLFTADSNGAQVLASLPRGGMGPYLTVTISHEPWGEATITPVFSLDPLPPRITSGEVRFLTPDVALVDSTALTSGQAAGSNPATPLLLVMKKEGDRWKIASIYLLPATSPTPSPTR